VAFSAAIGGMMTLVGTGPNIFVKGFADKYDFLSVPSPSLSPCPLYRYYSSGSTILQISFANFLLFAMPIGLIMLVLCWFWLQILYNRKGYAVLRTRFLIAVREIYFRFLRFKKSDPNEIESRTNLNVVLTEQYKELGPLSWQESIVAILFVVAVLLWVTRDFSSFPGWAILFRKKYVV
jgi:solute carrier family 13 (sodium-dependent dicarboxylate transporter), member 2/3/5